MSKVKTRIKAVEKRGRYLVFIRDDGKECKYDFATGNMIGFSGRNVNNLKRQLQNLTTDRLIRLIEDKNYKAYFKYIKKYAWENRACHFIECIPYYANYEQFFAIGIYNISPLFNRKITDIPKGLLNICKEYNIELTSTLFNSYKANPDIYHMIKKGEFDSIPFLMGVNIILYNDPFGYKRIVNENDLTRRNVIKRAVDQEHDSYFTELINKYGYTAKKLLSYINVLRKSHCSYRTKSVCKMIMDYADIMSYVDPEYNKYPIDLLKRHRNAERKYNELNMKYDEEEYSKRKVLKYECEIDGFKFIYPKDTSQIQKEGKDQHNCVGSYVKRVLSEECHIMFMRPINSLDKSYITLEIEDDEIIQAFRKYNARPNDEELEIISKWNQIHSGTKLENVIYDPEEL